MSCSVELTFLSAAIAKSLEIKEEIDHVRRQTFFLEQDIGKTSKQCIQYKNGEFFNYRRRNTAGFAVVVILFIYIALGEGAMDIGWE